MSDSSTKNYLKQKVNPIFEKMVIELVMQKPQDVTRFMIKWLTDNGESIEKKTGV